MALSNIFNAIKGPVDAIHDFFKGSKKVGSLEVGEKTVAIETKPAVSKEEAKVWITAEKVLNTAEKVFSHPITQKILKGIINKAVDKFEVTAMETVAGKFSDAVLPGDVAFAPLAYKGINFVAGIIKS